MDKAIELRGNKIIYLVDRMGISDEQSIQETEKLILTEVLDKTDGVIRRLDKTLKKTQRN